MQQFEIEISIAGLPYRRLWNGPDTKFSRFDLNNFIAEWKKQKTNNGAMYFTNSTNQRHLTSRIELRVNITAETEEAVPFLAIQWD